MFKAATAVCNIVMGYSWAVHSWPHFWIAFGLALLFVALGG